MGTLWILLAGLAMADPGDRAAALPVRRDGRPGLVVVLADDTVDGLTAPAVAVTAGGVEATVALADDGVAPDAVAGDRVFTGALSPAPAAREADFVLREGDTALWADRAPLGGGSPTVRLVYGKGGTAVVFDTDRPAPTGSVAPATAAQSSGGRSLAVVLGVLGLGLGLWLGLTLAPVLPRAARPR